MPRIRAVYMDNLRGLLNIRRIDKVSNARIRQKCGVTKGMDEKIDEGVLRFFGHMVRRENDRIPKRVYVDDVLVVDQWVCRGRGGLIP